jgi:hypothetical protein
MKKRKFKIGTIRTLPVLILVLSWSYVYPGQSGVVQIINNATAPFDEVRHLGSLPAPLGKKVPVDIRYQGGVFFTESRKDKMGRFKCSECHNNEKVTIGQAAEAAHGDMALDHGGVENPLSCFTCHNKDERDFLTAEKNVKINMDHSYKMCGQCHFRQKKDWVGGAHGKRISHWAGERVVKNCASCHDPHSPHFEKQWPKTYSLPLDE